MQFVGRFLATFHERRSLVTAAATLMSGMVTTARDATAKGGPRQFTSLI